MADYSAGQTTQTPVIPPPYVFDPPVPTTPRSSSSSSHSSRKRPRSSINNDPSIGAPASIAFSETVKRNVAQLLGSFCWHCGATPVQVCHVIPKKDGSVRLPTLTPDFRRSRSVAVSRTQAEWLGHFRAPWIRAKRCRPLRYLPREL